MVQKTTTIPVSPQVRDRLKTYGTMGHTYNDILSSLMDRVERQAFVAELRREIDDPASEWVDVEDLEWEDDS